MTLEEEVRRAGQAAEVLQNELFKSAVRDIEEAIFNGIRQSNVKDTELREKLCQQYTLLHALLGQLRTHLETGKLAEETIRQRVERLTRQAVNW